MNERLARLLAERKPSRRGVHGTGNIYTAVDEYERQFAEWQACGFAWVKLLASGDSQVETVRRLTKQTSIIPIIRFYSTECPGNTITKSLLTPYVDAGCVVFESQYNEFYYDHENAWRSALGVASVPTVGDGWAGQIVRADLSKMTWPPTRQVSIAGMPGDWPAQVAHGWAQFANEVLKAGGVPTTPAVEGWQYERIFVPLMRAIAKDHEGLLRQSIVAGHWRTLNHPIDYVKDTGAWLAWTHFDQTIYDLLGERLPLMCTESGPEPGWNMDATYPPITPAMHAEMVKAQLAWPTPDNYLCDAFWLWEGSGAWDGARWKNNHQHAGGGDLPVVAMLKDWQPEPQEPDEPEFPDEPPDPVADAARETADESVKMLNWGIKYALRHNLTPFHRELPFTVAGENWFAWPVHNSDGDTGLVVYPENGYTDAQTRIVDWEV